MAYPQYQDGSKRRSRRTGHTRSDSPDWEGRIQLETDSLPYEETRLVPQRPDITLPRSVSMMESYSRHRHPRRPSDRDFMAPSSHHRSRKPATGSHRSSRREPRNAYVESERDDESDGGRSIARSQASSRSANRSAVESDSRSTSRSRTESRSRARSRSTSSSISRSRRSEPVDVRPRKSSAKYHTAPAPRRRSRSASSGSSVGSRSSRSSRDYDKDRRHRSRKDKAPAAPKPHRRSEHRRHPPRQREKIIYEEDEEVAPRPKHVERIEEGKVSPHRRQKNHSTSRSSSSRRGYRHESREDGRIVLSSKRPSGLQKYYSSDVAYSPRSQVPRSQTTSGSHITSTHSMSSSSKRSSFVGSFFGPPLAMRPSPDKPVKLYECVVCMDDVPSRKAPKLKCGHRMCQSCLKRSFRLSIKDPQQMPPKCCSADHIPVEHVSHLFDTAFKMKWNSKFAEYSTRNRIYCPAKRCGEWIKPSQMHKERDGRKSAKCGRCKTKVCVTCNGKWHSSTDCPKDEETLKVLQQAQEEGWQRCFNCRSVVELKEGCNHMTCRCGSEFCMICGVKWKSCDCPWFSYDAVEQDRLEHMNVPMHLPQQHPADRDRDRDRDRERDRYDANPMAPREFWRGDTSTSGFGRTRPQSYEEEMHLRQLQEERDEHLARRLQFDEDDELVPSGPGDIVGIGNASGHFMNEDYRRGQQGFIVPPGPPPPPAPVPPPANAVPSPQSPPKVMAPPPPPQNMMSPPPPHPMPVPHNPMAPLNPMAPQPAPMTPPDRANADYLSGVNRARGVRQSSLERRLADRFSETRQATSPPHRAYTMPMPPPPPPPLGHPPPMMGHPPPVMGHPPPPMPGPPIPGPPMMRRHTMEDEICSPTRSPRHSERAMPRRPRPSIYEEEQPEYELSNGRRRHRTSESQKDSVLAGLTGLGRGMNRVYEWRNHVKPGDPDPHTMVAG